MASAKAIAQVLGRRSPTTKAWLAKIQRCAMLEPTTIDDAAWAALLARSANIGVYAVKTSGIYCRFGCPSRSPLRKNVRVFAGAEQAVEAGFRACKRCKP